ncbi:MAG TPA: PQQ-binding-like beta-propeller repeat protein [Opitutaceae bacterium]|nr:PQQ-binding-like beta-propeller repeat protein [Opitutaceae bacterium]
MIIATAFVAAPISHAADWPMLGGRPDRNMVSVEKGLPVDWDAKGKSIKWSAELGQVTFGSPVIAGGRVFIGTNNDDPAVKEKRGVLKCFAEKDGRLLWRAVHEKLPDAGEDDGGIGICSTPCVAGDRVYYVSNRAELVCRAVEDGKVAWTLDLRALGVTPNQASASSPLVVDDLVFVVTGQGANNKTGVVKNPAAPSFLAVNRTTGKIAWQDNTPGAAIITGQWGSPAYGLVDGTRQVAFPGGDGWLYSFEPTTGKLLWKFNCKAHEKTSAAGERETSFNLVSAPVFAGDQVFVAIGEPEAGSAPGALRCIDARQRGDVTKTAEVWRLGGEAFNDSLSTVAVHEGLVYAADAAGFLSCIDAKTGQRLWVHDNLSNIWGSPLVADGKLFLQIGEGAVHIFALGREKKVLVKNESLPDMAHGTPVAANGVLYLTGQKKLYAIAAK